MSVHLLSRHVPRATQGALGDGAALVLEVVDVLMAVAIVSGGEDALQCGWVSLLARWLPAAPQRVPVVGLQSSQWRAAGVLSCVPLTVHAK